MNIYFVNKNSKLKSPFDITDARRHKIMRVGDVCIREYDDGLAFLLLCDETNSWRACKCIATASGNIGLDANCLLFSFDGIHKRYGRSDILLSLSKLFAEHPLHDFFQLAMDIVEYKFDYWDVSLYLEIDRMKPTSMVCTDAKSKSASQNRHVVFEDYLTEACKVYFQELHTKGLSMREVYKEIRQRYPQDFRKSLQHFLEENPTSTIYDK